MVRQGQGYIQRDLQKNKVQLEQIVIHIYKNTTITVMLLCEML